MKQSVEQFLVEKIHELRVVASCSDKEEAKIIKVGIDAYMDALIAVRRSELDSVRINPKGRDWEATIGESKFLIRKVSYDSMHEGYECYYIHPHDSEFMKLISNGLCPSLDEATDLIMKKHREGIA